MDRFLSQSEADALIALEKHSKDASFHDFPGPGARLALPLESADGREKFVLDVSRGRIRLEQCTYQNRARSAVVLLRLDLGGPPHQNPDHTIIPCPHLHIYREGFGDKWAHPLPSAFSQPMICTQLSGNSATIATSQSYH
jgi:hypothetical protein